MTSVCRIACLLLAWTASASAAPYELVAIYSGRNADQTTRTVEVKVANNAVLPNRADGLDLDSVVIRFERAGLGSITPGTFRNFSIATRYRDIKSTTSVQSSELTPSASRTLVKWRDVRFPQRATYFDVSIHGKFSSDFLCAQELYLRQLVGQPRGCADPTRNPACGKTDFYGKPALRPERPVFSDGAEVLFTFCGREEAVEQVKWDLVLKDGGFGKADTSAKLNELHKSRLHRLLIDKGALTKFVNQYGDLRSAPDAEGLPGNLFVEEDFKFSVRLVGELFVLAEADHSKPREFSEVIDQRSTLVVKASGAGVGDCPNLADFKYVFEFTGDGDQATIDELPVRFRDACTSVLNVDLKKYLDKRVTMRILQQVDSEQKLVLVETQFTVASLGFQWTVPVVSEVIAALRAKSPADLTASSSLPLGIALGREGRYRLALSFAFRASWNIRSFTNLSRYFALYGHASVLADPDNDYSTELAIGAGVAAFQFFHFGWAVSLADDHRNYFLLTVDIKDISKYVVAERTD
jgi:hypothetical protein